MCLAQASRFKIPFLVPGVQCTLAKGWIGVFVFKRDWIDRVGTESRIWVELVPVIESQICQEGFSFQFTCVISLLAFAFQCLWFLRDVMASKLFRDSLVATCPGFVKQKWLFHRSYSLLYFIASTAIKQNVGYLKFYFFKFFLDNFAYMQIHKLY